MIVVEILAMKCKVCGIDVGVLSIPTTSRINRTQLKSLLGQCHIAPECVNCIKRDPTYTRDNNSWKWK